MIIIAIDPGITGAIAALDHRGRPFGLHDMPVMERSSGFVQNQVSPSGLDCLLGILINGSDRNEVMVMLERVGPMPKQAVSTVFSMGLTMGLIEGIIVGRRLAHTFVTPQEWKRAVGLPRVSKDEEGAAKDRKKRKGKDLARALAQKLYPDAELPLVKHHNRAEALLIARFGHERFA